MDYQNGTAVRVRTILRPCIHKELWGKEGVVVDSHYHESTHMTDVKVRFNCCDKEVVFKQVDLELV